MKLPPLKPNFARFYVVRHGETEWNAKKILQGQKDSPLTTKGRKQVKETAKLLSHIKFEAVFSSDLGRTYQSAKILTSKKDVEIKTTRLLRERNFGKFAGKKVDYFRSQLKKALEYQKKLNQAESLRYQLHPEIETSKQIAERVIRFIKTTALTYPEKNILVVTHGGVMEVLLVKLGLINKQKNNHGLIANAAYMVVDSDGVDLLAQATYGIKI